MPDFDDDARLHEMFAEFRTEVAPYVNPPGTAAARRRVRHRRRAGAAAIAAGAVLFVGGPTVGFVAANNDTPTPPPIGPTVLPTPGPTTPAPTPTTAATATAADPTEAAVPEVTGKVFYLAEDGKIHVDGHTYPGGGSGVFPTISPDGRRVAWVTSDQEGGDLVVSDLDGRNRRTVLHDTDPYCQEPAWSADSKRVLVIENPGGPDRPAVRSLAVVTIASGKVERLGKPEGCHYAWSADGKRVATTTLVASVDHIATSVVVHDLHGGHRVTLPRRLVGDRVYTDMAGISADGNRVCVATASKEGPWGDIGPSIGCDTVIDVAARKVLDLPMGAGRFLADGGMLVQVESDKETELVRLDAHDRVVARSIESTDSTTRLIIGYTP